MGKRQHKRQDSTTRRDRAKADRVLLQYKSQSTDHLHSTAYCRFIHSIVLKREKKERRKAAIMKFFVGILLTLLLSACLCVVAASQEYYDDYGNDGGVDGGDYYQQQEYGGDYYGDEGGGGGGNDAAAGDSLYADYAKREQDKAMGKAGGLSPVLKNVLVGAASYIVGAKFHSRRAIKKQEKSSSRQQQKLYERYVQDVSALQLQNSQLQEYIQQSTVQQLTEEFLTADTNNDRRVSRLEFEKYKKQYLEKHPDADPGMFPRFEDFDPDHNGMVTLKEHEDYYRQQGMVA